VSLFKNEETEDRRPDRKKTRPIISFIINLNKINSPKHTESHRANENATKEMWHKKKNVSKMEKDGGGMTADGGK